jgi:hypothetical protein
MPTVEFRMDVSGIPHTYIIVNNGAGATQMYGFAPAAEGHLWGVGHIYDESASGQNGGPHSWDYTTGPIDITPDQYNKMIDEINHAIANPPYYNLPASILFSSAVNQCATWANHLADVGGFKDKLPWGSNGWNPYGQSVWTELRKYWIAVGNGHNGINDIDYDINGNVNLWYQKALTWHWPADPLVLDLDGDGIEATAIDPASPILFDHDADGVKTATGWIKADDGIVVLDLNGNGSIDTGRELFGDNTLLSDGTRAANGFAAIAQHDGNSDGKISSQDAVYSQLRIWQDANQDGTSQAGELHTLAEMGIASINVNGTASDLQLGNGNSQPWSGSYTRINGTTGASGTPELSGSLLLAANDFYREFTDDPALSTEAQALPQMRASGWVRDLREAMSLGTAEAAANAWTSKASRESGTAHKPLTRATSRCGFTTRAAGFTRAPCQF